VSKMGNMTNKWVVIENSPDGPKVLAIVETENEARTHARNSVMQSSLSCWIGKISVTYSRTHDTDEAKPMPRERG
jgi:hypothetical protein